MYVRPLTDIIQEHGIHYHTYADDTHLYVHCTRDSVNDMECAISRLEQCLLDVREWMSSNGLKLNDAKTQWIILNWNPSLCGDKSLKIGHTIVPQSTTIRNLGFVLDQQLTMQPHINGVCRSAYYYLRRIKGRILGNI